MWPVNTTCLCPPPGFWFCLLYGKCFPTSMLSLVQNLTLYLHLRPAREARLASFFRSQRGGVLRPTLQGILSNIQTEASNSSNLTFQAKSSPWGEEREGRQGERERN